MHLALMHEEDATAHISCVIMVKVMPSAASDRPIDSISFINSGFVADVISSHRTMQPTSYESVSPSACNGSAALRMFPGVRENRVGMPTPRNRPSVGCSYS